MSSGPLWNRSFQERSSAGGARTLLLSVHQFSTISCAASQFYLVIPGPLGAFLSVNTRLATPSLTAVPCWALPAGHESIDSVPPRDCAGLPQCGSPAAGAYALWSSQRPAAPYSLRAACEQMG